MKFLNHIFTCFYTYQHRLSEISSICDKQFIFSWSFHSNQQSVQLKYVNYLYSFYVFRDRFGSHSPEEYLNLRFSHFDAKLSKEDIKDILEREFHRFAPFEAIFKLFGNFFRYIFKIMHISFRNICYFFLFLSMFAKIVVELFSKYIKNLVAD